MDGQSFSADRNGGFITEIPDFFDLIGIDIVANQPIQLCDSNGQVLHTVTVPFSLQRSSSLLTSPLLKTGVQYTVKTQGYEKTFTQTDPFTIVR